MNDLTASRYQSGMSDGFGWMYRMSLGLALRRLRMEDHSADRIRRASEQGPVVYALHTPSEIDWLALNAVLLARRLPLPIYTNDLRGGWFRPVQEWAAGWWERISQGAPPDAVASGWLAEQVRRGQPCCLFMARQSDPLEWLGLRQQERGDPLEALQRAQEGLDRPVQILPVVVLWDRARPEGVVRQFIEGLEELPGPFGRLWSLAQASDPLVQVGEPVSVQEFEARYHEEKPERRRKMLRMLLRRYLHREAQVVLGPRARAWNEVRRQVLRSPEIRALVQQESRAAGQPPEKVGRALSKMYGNMAARLNGRWLRFAGLLTDMIWDRLYSGLDIRPEDLERIREAMRRGTAILLPCHRSHLDYLLLSSLLYRHDIAIPHVVAGDNLSFWPLGAIFRRLGAFFIRRSFQGDRLFPPLFSRYLQELIRMEVPIEFFMEGGRSRNGRLLPARIGVLRMIIDATRRDGRVAAGGREVSLLPIYIGYARLAEERVFERELLGARKEKESVAGVVRAASVLRQRYGRVYVRVGEPMPASEVAGAWEELSEEARTERLRMAGARLLHRINQETLILPVGLVALSVLAHGRRGIRQGELTARAQRFLGYLLDLGLKAPEGQAPESRLEEAIAALVAGRMLKPHDSEGVDGEAGAKSTVYAISPERRVRLEWYKNTLLTPLAPLSWYCAAIRALGQDAVDQEAVGQLFELQATLFQREFLFDPDKSSAARREDSRQRLCRWGVLTADPETGGLRVSDRARIGELATLTVNLAESYLLVLRVLERAGAAPSDVPKEAMALGKTLLAVDELSRPEALSLQNLQHAAKILSARTDRAQIGQALRRLLEVA